jgi:alpha-L-fucosidase 2
MSRYFLVVLGCIISTITVSQINNRHEKLWYNKPANASVKDLQDGWTSDSAWLNALPVGNGFIGAMVFGDVKTERLQLNDKTLWSGSPDDNDNPDAAAAVKEIRDLLFAGKFKEATVLTNKTQVCKGVGSAQGNAANAAFGCYQTLGDLWMDFNRKTTYSKYYRDIDLLNGIANVRYQQDGIQFSREIFASYPDKVLVVHLAADKPGSISLKLAINRPERFTTTVKGNRMIMSGVLDDGKAGAGMKYKVQVIPVLKGGSLKAVKNDLIVTAATELTLIISSATDYRLHYPDYKNENYKQEQDELLKAVVKKSYKQLREQHVKDFSSFMSRSYMRLDVASAPALPVDELIRRNAVTKNEPALYSLYYQYGRYLLLSSSRKGSLPANLQGIWANKIQTPWNGDYHTDINVQMNYWPAEVANLTECHEQLIELAKSIVEPGKRTAQTQYQMEGWCIHPITNVWGYTAPGEHPSWGMHVGAAAWLNQHLWDHFAYNRDTGYLKSVWEILQSSGEFYLNWLVKDPATGKLVSGPAASPENAFITASGDTIQISMGPSHDQEVINDLFTHIIQAAAILKIPSDDPGVRKISEARSLLAMPGIASDGRLMEWAQEYKEADPHHRHTSHLFDLYPGNRISLVNSPELVNAARKSLEARGDGGNGWSLAWKICFWARLHDGDRALKLLNNLLQPVTTMGTLYDNGGGSYLNLFDACPPFQIDGNFGATAGIAEMLLQSQENYIELLPSLPSSWRNGEVKGLCARGGYVINMKWKNNKLVSADLLSRKGGSCTLKYADQQIVVQSEPGKKYDLMPLLK